MGKKPRGPRPEEERPSYANYEDDESTYSNPFEETSRQEQGRAPPPAPYAPPPPPPPPPPSHNHNYTESYDNPAYDQQQGGNYEGYDNYQNYQQYQQDQQGYSYPPPSAPPAPASSSPSKRSKKSSRRAAAPRAPPPPPPQDDPPYVGSGSNPFEAEIEPAGGPGGRGGGGAGPSRREQPNGEGGGNGGEYGYQGHPPPYPPQEYQYNGYQQGPPPGYSDPSAAYNPYYHNGGYPEGGGNGGNYGPENPYAHPEGQPYQYGEYPPYPGYANPPPAAYPGSAAYAAAHGDAGAAAAAEKAAAIAHAGKKKKRRGDGDNGAQSGANSGAASREVSTREKVNALGGKRQAPPDRAPPPKGGQNANGNANGDGKPPPRQKPVKCVAPPEYKPPLTAHGAIFTFFVGSFYRGHLRPFASLALYSLLFLMTSGVQWGFRGYADEIVTYEYSKRVLKRCSSSGSCVGKQAVLRVALGNTFFFTLMFLVTLGGSKKSQWRVKWHSGYWFPKILVWLGAIFGCFFVPFPVLERYATGAKVIAGVWLLVMIITLLDTVYTINRWLLTDRNNGRFGCQMFLLIIVMLLGYFAGFACLGGAVYMFVKDAGGCKLNVGLVASTGFLCLLYTACSLAPHRYEDSGLLTAGGVFAYCGFLTFSALASGTKAACRRVKQPQNATNEPTWIVITSFVLACMSIGWSAAMAAYDQVPIWRGFQMLVGYQSKEERENKYINPHAKYKPSVYSSQYNYAYEMHDPEEIPYRPDVMHFLYALASSYMGMVLTSWSVDGTAAKFEADKGQISMWVKIGSSWAIGLMYGWTVILPEFIYRRDPYRGQGV